MIVCPNCGRRFAHVPVLPLVCGCTNPKPNAWVIIHTRYAAAIESGVWSESLEREWLTQEFRKLLPCATCGNSWLGLEGKIDLSTAENAFRSLWQIHNTVSAEHVSPPKQPISFELCRALYLQQPTLDDCCQAVTSLSLLPNHLEVQSRCLDSWRRAGLTIHAKNTSRDIEQLQGLYPQVSSWHVNDKLPTEYAKPTQSIHGLIQTAAEIGETILLINSDIEIHGEQRVIREAIADGVLVGIRHDYKREWWVSERFIWGLDVFSFTPDQARDLPYDPYAIGKPVWDYWIPQHFRTRGTRMHFIGEPFFFHKLHATNWNNEEWHIAAEWFAARFGFMRTQPESVLFRKSLPFPPP